jgi:hypothetical protein
MCAKQYLPFVARLAAFTMINSQPVIFSGPFAFFCVQKRSQPA